MINSLNLISLALQNGEEARVQELVQAALEQSLPPQVILEDGLLSGMTLVGEEFKMGQVFVPEVLMAARAMNAGTALLKPYLKESGTMVKGTVCLGTVQGDMHDIGKNLVRLMMESKGLKVIDLGVNVPVKHFIETAVNEACGIIACSALLTTTMMEMKSIVAAAEEAGIRGSVKIMVGGAPVNAGFCSAIGADCYTPDAVSAASAAVNLLS